MNFEKKVNNVRNSFELSHGIRRALVSSLALIYFISLGFDVIWITTLFAISTILLVIFEFPTSAIADYDSRKKSIIISHSLFVISFLGLFFFNEFWILSLFWIVGDLAWAFSSGASASWAIDALRIAKKKTKLVAFVSQGFFFEKTGWLLGGLLGIFIVAYNFRYLWIFLAGLYFILALIATIFIEEKNFKQSRIPQNYLSKTFSKAIESISFIIHKKNKNLRVLLIGGFASTFAISTLFVAFPLFLVNTLSINAKWIPGIYSLTAALAILGPPLAYKIAGNDRNLKEILVGLFFLMGTLIITLALNSSIYLIIFFMILTKIILAMADVIEDSALHHEFDSKIRASLSSVNSIGWAIFSSLATFIAGITITFLGEATTMTIAGGFAILSSMIYHFGLKDI